MLTATVLHNSLKVATCCLTLANNNCIFFSAKVTGISIQETFPFIFFQFLNFFLLPGNVPNDHCSTKTDSSTYSIDGLSLQGSFSTAGHHNEDSYRQLFHYNNHNSNSSSLQKRQFAPLQDSDEGNNCANKSMSGTLSYDSNKTSPPDLNNENKKNSVISRNEQDHLITSSPLHHVTAISSVSGFSYNYNNNTNNNTDSFAKVTATSMGTTTSRASDSYNNIASSTTNSGSRDNISMNSGSVAAVAVGNAGDAARHGGGFTTGNIYTPHPYHHHHHYPQHHYPASVLAHHHHHFYHANSTNLAAQPGLTNSFYHHHHHHHQPQSHQHQQQQHQTQLQPFYNISKHAENFEQTNNYSSYLDGLHQHHTQETLPTYLSAFGSTASSFQPGYPASGGGGVSLGGHMSGGGVASAVGGVGSNGGSGSAFNVVHSQYTASSASFVPQSHGIQQSTGITLKNNQ